ncbi:MAG: J domain-containing protein [Saprospiraceae bacterium]|nr:J domain-containing protein [Saprospiraceae bacterium]
MTATTFTIQEKEEIRKLFGLPLEQLDLEAFRKAHRELRSKYHPDNFEHLDNEAVKEMATEKFQVIESLAGRVESYLTGEKPAAPTYQTNVADYLSPHAVFAGKKLKIEILTADKDLKYHLFGTFYRWLQFGDSFKIPDTGGSIVIDEDYAGRRIGFQESVRMYLTFGEADSIEDMVNWLYGKIQGRASKLLVAGETVEIDPEKIVNAIKKETLLRIGAG